MEQTNLEGITVDGNKPLSTYLSEKETEATVAEVEKEVKDQKDKLFHKPRTRYKYEEPHSRTRHLSRREINSEYWGDNMKQAKSLAEKCIVLLLRGGGWTAQQMFKVLIVETPEKERRPKKMGVVSAALGTIDKSELGALIQKTNVATGKSKKWEYQFVPCALHMEAKDAIALYKKTGEGKRFHLSNAAEKYKSIHEFLRTSTKGEGFKEPETPQTQAERKPARRRSDESGLDAVTNGIQGAIEDYLRQTLGVRVEVTGKVDININFGLTTPKH